MRTSSSINPSLVAQIEHVLSQSIQVSDYSLARIRAAAADLALLHVNATVVTVAGTNGKGSLVCALEQILLASGLNVGAYTSPHLHCLTERIRINARQSNAADWLEFVQKYQKVLSMHQLTFYEVTTLCAIYMLDKRYQCDVVILEVGLGGEFDAVNLWDAAYVGLTNVDLDHTAILGDTIEAILKTKMQVIKSDAQVVTGLTEKFAFWDQHMQSCGATVDYMCEDFWFESTGQQVFQFKSHNMGILQCEILGYRLKAWHWLCSSQGIWCLIANSCQIYCAKHGES